MLTEYETTGQAQPSPRLKMRMLQQMAEALDDEAEGLYHRAAAFEDEEFLLTREIEQRQTEINRITLKRESLRGERDRLLEKVETLKSEAAAMREEVFNGEAEMALDGFESRQAGGNLAGGEFMSLASDSNDTNESRGTTYFRRMRPGEPAR